MAWQTNVWSAAMRFGLVLAGVAMMVGAGLPPPAYAVPRPNSNVPQNATAPTNGRTLEQAVQCSAALQVAALAAPDWAKDRAIAQISDAWLAKVFELGRARGLGGDQVPDLIKADMGRQVDLAARDPDALSRRAFNCASIKP